MISARATDAFSIAAAKKYGVRGVGFEIDPGLVKLARENARREGVEKLVEIREQDFLTANLSPASVVTLYLSYDGNLAVRPQLLQQLKPGARVVSYVFDMGDWQPKIAETYCDCGWRPASVCCGGSASRWCLATTLRKFCSRSRPRRAVDHRSE